GLPVGEIAAADLARAEELAKGAPAALDESRDQSLLDSFVMRMTAMQDALAMGGASKADRRRQWDEVMKKILAFVALRAQAIVLGGRGYDARLLGNLDTAGLAIVRDGRPLALVDQRGLWLFPGLAEATVDALFADVDAARAHIEELMSKHMDRESLDKTALAVWRAARAGGQPPVSGAQVSEERSVSRPESAPTRDDRAAAKALV